MIKNGLIVLSFLLPAYLIRFSVFGIPTTLLEILIYALLVTKLITVVKNKQKVIFGPYLIPAILLLISGLVSTYIAPDKMVALGLLKAYIIDPIIFYWLVVNEFKREERIQLLYGLTASALYVGAYSVWQRFSGNVSIDGRVVGLFGYSPNYSALYLVPLVVSSFVFGFSKLGAKPQFYKVILILAGAALIFSNSRASIIASSVGIMGFLVLWSWKKLAKSAVFWMAGAIIAIAVVVIGYIQIGPDFNANPDIDGRTTASSNLRIEVWKTTLEIIKEKPITGAGLGNYQNYFTELTKNRVNYPEYISPWALTPHNMLLNFWVNLGILGLVSVIWAVVIFIKQQNLANKKSTLCLALMLAILINGLFDTPYWKNDLAIVFWMILAL